MPSSQVNVLAETALANRLMGAVEAWMQHDADGLARSLLVFQHAGALLACSAGDAPIVLAAALLLPHAGDDVGDDDHGPRPEPEDDRAKGRSRSADFTDLLRSVGLDEAAIGKIARLLEAFRRRVVLDTPEFRILHDARLLGRMAADRAEPEASRHAIAADFFCTEAGWRRARELFECGP